MEKENKKFNFYKTNENDSDTTGTIAAVIVPFVHTYLHLFKHSLGFTVNNILALDNLNFQPMRNFYFYFQYKRYYKKFIKLLAVYTDLELCGSVLGKEYEKTVAKRLIDNYLKYPDVSYFYFKH